MPVPRGSEVYDIEPLPPGVTARGLAYARTDLDEAMRDRVPGVLADVLGALAVAALLSDLPLTGFGDQVLKETLEIGSQEEHTRGWRQGEALAEAWLMDHRGCEFPWPMSRDLRHPRASLPGMDLIGFVRWTADDYRLAFGQVKTSKEERHPPQVVTEPGRGLVAQMLALRDDRVLKSTALQYLAHRAIDNPPWAPMFRSAATRFLDSGGTEFWLFGFLVRDVDPHEKDLRGGSLSLACDCPTCTVIELWALYLPSGSIPSGPQHGSRRRRGASS